MRVVSIVLLDEMIFMFCASSAVMLNVEPLPSVYAVKRPFTPEIESPAAMLRLYCSMCKRMPQVVMYWSVCWTYTSAELSAFVRMWLTIIGSMISRVLGAVVSYASLILMMVAKAWAVADWMMKP